MSLAQTLSLSGEPKLMAEDMAGLEDVVKVAKQTKDIIFAVVISPQGEILASTESNYIGQHVSDANGKQLLGLPPEHRILQDESNLIDVAVPVSEEGKWQLGWVRVEMTRDTANANLRAIATAGLGIASSLLLMIIIIATRLARRLTNGLDRLARVATDAKEGRPFKRLDMERVDEIGVLARHLYRMLDTIDEEKKENSISNEHLRRESEKLLALLHNASDGIHILDTEGNAIEASDSFCVMLGYRRDEVIGMNVSQWDAKFKGTELTEAIRQLYVKQGRSQFETCHCRKDGTIIDVEVSSFPLELAGKPVLFCSSRDISERKHLVEALKENELRYRTVADYTSDWEYWIMPDNTFRYMSPSCEQVSGYTAGEFFADPQLLTQIIHPDDLHLYVGHRHRLSDQNVSEPLDFRIYTKGGELRWISHVCRPVYDSSGNHIGQRASNRDITERKAAEEQIRNLAFYDILTQLPNRRLLNDRLGKTMAASKRNGRYGALMFLDLDNFKPLNDTYGHESGDMLLIEAARRLNSCVREVDTVARLGGDEFIVMLSELDADKAESTAQADIVAEKIRSSLAEPYLLTIRQEGKAEDIVEHRCTSSIGVVVFINHEASSEDLIKWADKAMYQAKEDGRNLIRFFDPQGGSDVSLVNQGIRILRLNWIDSYNCGEPTIDQEHRKLFDLANALIEFAFTRNENPQGFDSALEKLLAHVVQHFADEEAILAKYLYPDLEVHARAHKVLVDHALQLRDTAAKGGVTLGELVNFLADEVVTQHMLKTDGKFYSLFKNSQISQHATQLHVLT